MRFSNAMSTIGMNLEEGFIDAAFVGLSDLGTICEGAIDTRGEEDRFNTCFKHKDPKLTRKA